MDFWEVLSDLFLYVLSILFLFKARDKPKVICFTILGEEQA